MGRNCLAYIVFSSKSKTANLCQIQLMLLNLIITLLTTVMPESLLRPHKQMAVQPTDLKS